MAGAVVGWTFDAAPWWPVPPAGADPVPVTVRAEMLEPGTLARRFHPGDTFDVPAERLANLVVLGLAAIDLDDVPPWWPLAGSIVDHDVDLAA